jgi:hypothetical protein
VLSSKVLIYSLKYLREKNVNIEIKKPDFAADFKSFKNVPKQIGRFSSVSSGACGNTDSELSRRGDVLGRTGRGLGRTGGAHYRTGGALFRTGGSLDRNDGALGRIDNASGGNSEALRKEWWCI